PASARRSAALSVTLYPPRKRTPKIAVGSRAERAGNDSRRVSATAVRSTLETRRRPSVIDPGDSTRPAARMPTNAEPQRATGASPATKATVSVRDVSASVEVSASVHLGSYTGGRDRPLGPRRHACAGREAPIEGEQRQRRRARRRRGGDERERTR